MAYRQDTREGGEIGGGCRLEMSGISAILTAAGESTRMGRFKPLLRWHGFTLLEYQICSLVEGGVDEVVVVLGHQADLIVPHVKRLGVRYVVNPDYRLGKTTSIKAGLQSISSSAESILLMAVDQPRTKEIVSTVVQSHIKSQSLITSPRFRGHGGHPLIFSASLKGDLEVISEQGQGLRQVFQAHRVGVTEVEFNDPLVSLDINTFEDYEIAKKNYRA